jgi:hypothetical protein
MYETALHHDSICNGSRAIKGKDTQHSLYSFEEALSLVNATLFGIAADAVRGDMPLVEVFPHFH